jgi:thiamine-monophosphate kinase
LFRIVGATENFRQRSLPTFAAHSSMTPENQRTEISSLGEFGLIDHLAAPAETVQAGTILGIGDDAAVIDHFGKQTVITTDLLLEGIHFDLAYYPLKHLGYKAVAVNISDLCAMMATPTHITVSIGISNRFSVEALDEFYAGVYAACARYGVDLVGGDTSSSLKGFVISVTAIGEVNTGAAVTRTGAAASELLCVTGELGAPYLGLQILEREKRIFLENPGVQPDLGQRAHVIGRFLKPDARLDIVEWLREHDVVPTAMIDISDGLSSEILHLCRRSNVGAVLHEEKIPIHDETREVAFEMNTDPTACALSGGEEYQLLFTVKQSDYEKVARNGDISIVGYLTEESEGARIVTKAGATHKLTAQGWNAFDSEASTAG